MARITQSIRAISLKPSSLLVTRARYYLVTFTVTLVVCVTKPPFAVMVMVWLPKLALFAARICNVELPVPGAPIVALVKLTERSESVAALRLTAELNPFAAVVFTAAVVLDFRLTFTLGVAESAKSGAAAAFTVSDTVVLCTSEPLVPVIVTL